MVTFNLQEETDESEDENDSPQFEDRMSKAELRESTREYAEWYVENNSALEEVDLSKVDFSISTSFKRAAGKAGHNGNIDDQILRMAWKAYQKWGWNEDWTDTIEHELIHIWQLQVHGDANHGQTFKRKAREIDAPRHCPQFAKYKYKLFCKECGEQNGGRFKRSKIVKNPESYRSGCCGEPLRVEKN